jgi:hypothetical protein
MRRNNRNKKQRHKQSSRCGSWQKLVTWGSDALHILNALDRYLSLFIKFRGACQLINNTKFWCAFVDLCHRIL